MVEFNLNGVEGTFSSDFNGNRSVGVYAISETGRVVCYSSWNEIACEHTTQIRDGVLTGSRGPLQEFNGCEPIRTRRNLNLAR